MKCDQLRESEMIVDVGVCYECYILYSHLLLPLRCWWFHTSGAVCRSSVNAAKALRHRENPYSTFCSSLFVLQYWLTYMIWPGPSSGQLTSSPPQSTQIRLIQSQLTSRSLPVDSSSVISTIIYIKRYNLLLEYYIDNNNISRKP